MADGAVRIRLQIENLEVVIQHVNQHHLVLERLTHSGSELDRFRGLQSPHDAGKRGEDAERGGLQILFLVLGERAVIAGRIRLAEIKDTYLARASDGARGDKRLTQLMAHSVDRVAGLRVVTALDHNVRAAASGSSVSSLIGSV